jgi:hypothetical protein
MSDKKATPKPEVDPNDVEMCILGWLLDNDYQRPWSIDEVLREYRDPIAAKDALDNLQGAGLIHRLGDFVFATRAAVRAEEIKF